VNPFKRRSAIGPAKVFVSAAKTCGHCATCTPGVVVAVPVRVEESSRSEDESNGWQDIEPVPTAVFGRCHSPVYNPEMPPIPPEQARCLPDDLVYLYWRLDDQNPNPLETQSTTTMKHHGDAGDIHGPAAHLQSAVPWNYSVSKPFRDAFWRAFVADFHLWRKTRYPHLPFLAPPPDKARDWIILALHRSTHGKLADNIHHKLWGNPPNDDLSHDNWSLVFHSLDSVVAGCPFVTAGGWLGFGPTCMEPGDVVVVLAGADVPFIVRRKDDESGEFLLVGEAYVDGLMFGELFEHCPAFADNNHGYGIKMQRFCFC
jgi:hypothetical protein